MLGTAALNDDLPDFASSFGEKRMTALQLKGKLKPDLADRRG
jgi:hypothetical protein